MTHPNIEFAINYLRERGTNIPDDLLVQLRDLGYPLEKNDEEKIAKSIVAKKLPSKEMKQAGSYQAIRSELWASVYDAVYNFLNSTSQVDTYKSPLSVAVSKAYIETADTAYVDGGGTLPLDDDTALFASTELQAQLFYIDSLFLTLKQLRKEGDFDPISEAFARADGYTNSLDMLYNGVKLNAAGNKMLTFDGDDGKESCADCVRYKGQRHRASWWISRNAVPPSRFFACGGYHCEHRLFDDDGNEYTI